MDLVLAIVRGIAKTSQAIRRMKETDTQHWDTIMNMTVCNPPNALEPQDVPEIPPSVLPNVDGPDIPVDFDRSNFKTIYRDEYTGEELPHHLVRAAMAEELAYFNRVVWEAVDAESAKQEDAAKTIRTRWVLCNKGDSDAPDTRARLVACEVANETSDAFFASTPPLDAKTVRIL